MNKTAKRTYDQARYLRRRVTAVRSFPTDGLTLEELAYIAGIVDGEGSLCIMAMGPTRVLGPVLSISMCHAGVMAWLAQKLGTSAHPYRRTRAKEHWKPQFKVVLTGKRAIRLIDQLQPYLRVKATQAAAFVAFSATYANGGRGAVVGASAVEERVRLQIVVRHANDSRRPSQQRAATNEMHLA